MPLLYYVDNLQFTYNNQNPISRVVFNSKPLTEEAYEYELEYIIYKVNSSDATTEFVGSLGNPTTKFNSTLSILRVGSDGSLKVYSFYDRVERGGWEVTFSAFDREDLFSVRRCGLPSKCGSLGVCEDNQCVACPTPKGLLGWSKNCAPPKLPSCKAGSQSANYYKVVGVEPFNYGYTEGEGPIKLADCRAKCSKDCGCLGFFYREESSKCLVVPELGSLSKVSNQTHVAYIKM
ncbi:epidermis-specific secreted glycoprotein EP1-like [Thalictrum thalictroides]|uniref:Epidermis-specific secreted glycoprotein EP1-like n=1 Tax=Thalictrum thalictroides TaxID=46969 RepID=A0A7J6XDP4_THATH|nr:epidermis-specific secreted glycoprotein EP1-like [Thalictrum thalictroides]